LGTRKAETVVRCHEGKPKVRFGVVGGLGRRLETPGYPGNDREQSRGCPTGKSLSCDAQTIRWLRSEIFGKALPRSRSDQAFATCGGQVFRV